MILGPMKTHLYLSNIFVLRLGRSKWSFKLFSVNKHPNGRVLWEYKEIGSGHGLEERGIEIDIFFCIKIMGIRFLRGYFKGLRNHGDAKSQITWRREPRTLKQNTAIEKLPVAKMALNNLIIGMCEVWNCLLFSVCCEGLLCHLQHCSLGIILRETFG